MKRVIIALFVVLSVALFISCSGTPSEEVDVSLAVAIADYSNSKAIVSMVPEAEYYNVYLDGGDDPILHFGCISEAQKGDTFKGRLKPGRHTVVVYAFNREDVIIGKGEQSFTSNKNSGSIFDIDVVVRSYSEGVVGKTVSVKIKHASAVEASRIKVSIDEGAMYPLDNNKKHTFQGVEQGNHIFSLFYEDNCIFKTVMKKTADPLDASFSVEELTLTDGTVYLVRSENQSSDSSEIEVISGTHFKAGSKFQIEIEDYTFSFTDGDTSEDPANKPIVEVYCLQKEFNTYDTKGGHTGWYVERYNNDGKDYRINVKCSKLPNDLEGNFTISVVIKYGENHEKVWSIERDFHVYPSDVQNEVFNEDVYSRPDGYDKYRCPYCLKGNATTFDRHHNHKGFVCENCDRIVSLVDNRERIIHNCIAGIYGLSVEAQAELMTDLGLDPNWEIEVRVPANYEDVLYKGVVVKTGESEYVKPGGSNGHRKGFFFITCTADPETKYLVTIEGFTRETIDVFFYEFTDINHMYDDMSKGPITSAVFHLKDKKDWFDC